MANLTYAQVKALIGGGGAGLRDESLNERILSAMAVLASGQNPDASAWPGPVPTGTYAPSPWRVDVDTTISPLATVGAWGWALSSTYLTNYFFYNSSGAVNDRADIGYVPLPAGTWTVEVVSALGPAQGILTLALDDGAGNFTTLGTIDLYAAAANASGRGTIAGIVIATAIQNRKLRLLVAGKNAASTGFQVGASKIMFTRTA